MKRVYKASGVLKVVGIVLIIASLLLWLYGAIDKYWDNIPITEITSKTGIQASVGDWLSFDDHYYSALSRVSTAEAFSPATSLDGTDEEKKTAYITANLETVKPYFKQYFDKARGAENQRREALAAENLSWFERDFDVKAFAERYSSVEDLLQQQELEEMFTYIDGLQLSSSKGPKGKAASLKPASLQNEYRAWYDGLVETYGEEEAGTWYEFVSVVHHMLQDQAAQGSVNSKGWLDANFSWEAYQAGLVGVREEERAEAKNNVVLDLLDYCEKVQAGESADIDAVLNEIYQHTLSSFPEENHGDKTVFLASLRSLIEGGNFSGYYTTLRDTMRETDQALQSVSVNVAETNYATKVLEASYKRVGISGVSLLWAITAKHYQLLLTGILLIILSVVMRKLVDRRMLKQAVSEPDSDGDSLELTGGHADDVLLRVSHLKQYFRSGHYVTKAVDDVSFYVKKGEVFGLVGESGCGKTTTGRTIINLYDPTEGDVYFEGLRISSNQNGLPVLKASLRSDYRNNAAKLKAQLKVDLKQHPEDAERLKQEYSGKVAALKAELKEALTKAEDSALASYVEKGKSVERYRAKRKAELTEEFERESGSLSGEALAARTRSYKDAMRVASHDNIMSRMQMIFQDPIASINPRMTVREIIAEGLVIQGVKDKAYINQQVNRMLELVGLVPEHADRYPHEFSGGQRQRIGIARAIIMNPDLIIADEPISALDVSIQAQVINLLNDLREQMGLTIMFIAHNLSVVKYFSDRIAVMYYGKIVEMTTSDELFAHPLHPYTRSLLSAIPYPDPHYEKERVRIEYVPARAHDYSVFKPSMREITPGHYIYCNDPEFAQYQKELGL